MAVVGAFSNDSSFAYRTTPVHCLAESYLTSDSGQLRRGGCTHAILTMAGVAELPGG
jgi:hypothetical protein